jgi:hypothetical protein
MDERMPAVEAAFYWFSLGDSLEEIHSFSLTLTIFGAQSYQPSFTEGRPSRRHSGFHPSSYLDGHVIYYSYLSLHLKAAEAWDSGACFSRR